MNALARRALIGLIVTCSAAASAAETHDLQSPDGSLTASIGVDDDGSPNFVIRRGDQTVASGRLGLKLAGAEPLQRGLTIVDTKRATHDETYAIPVGKASSARDHHNELTVSFEESFAPKRRIDIVFRAFDDGVAFRYVLPKQEPHDDVVLLDELTQFTVDGASTAHAAPAGELHDSLRVVLRHETGVATRERTVDRRAAAHAHAARARGWRSRRRILRTTPGCICREANPTQTRSLRSSLHCPAGATARR